MKSNAAESRFPILAHGDCTQMFTPHHLSIHLSIFVSIYLCIYVPMYPCIYVFLYLYICISEHLNLCKLSSGFDLFRHSYRIYSNAYSWSKTKGSISSTGICIQFLECK